MALSRLSWSQYQCKQNLMTQPRKCYDRSLILFPSRRRSGCTPWPGLGPRGFVHLWARFQGPIIKNWTSFNYYSPKHTPTPRDTFWQNQGSPAVPHQIAPICWLSKAKISPFHTAFIWHIDDQKWHCRDFPGHSTNVSVKELVMLCNAGGVGVIVQRYTPSWSLRCNAGTSPVSL